MFIYVIVRTGGEAKCIEDNIQLLQRDLEDGCSMEEYWDYK